MKNSNPSNRALQKTRILKIIETPEPSRLTLCTESVSFEYYLVFQYRPLCERPCKRLQWGLQVNIKDCVATITTSLPWYCFSDSTQPGFTWANINCTRMLSHYRVKSLLLTRFGPNHAKSLQQSSLSIYFIDEIEINLYINRRWFCTPSISSPHKQIGEAQFIPFYSFYLWMQK